MSKFKEILEKAKTQSTLGGIYMNTKNLTSKPKSQSSNISNKLRQYLLNRSTTS